MKVNIQYKNYNKDIGKATVDIDSIQYIELQNVVEEVANC